jgi:hypothetical protein
MVKGETWFGIEGGCFATMGEHGLHLPVRSWAALTNGVSESETQDELLLCLL